MSVLPRSLCTVDGSLYIPDKVSGMHAIEQAQAQPEPPPQLSASQCTAPCRVIIIDVMGVLQCMKKTATMLKLSDFQAAFIQRVDTMMKGFNECCVVFDRYLD